MELPVVSEPGESPWYADGLRFTCSQCGNCCTGGPGYVWISREEIDRLADFLKLSSAVVIERYCRRLGGRYSLKEQRGERGYDCVFLTEMGKASASPGGVKLKKYGCAIYPVRPLQCRTWPFWTGNLGDRDSWEHAAQRCHGMNHGKRTFTQEQIEALRDAKEWPESPPTSATRP